MARAPVRITPAAIWLVAPPRFSTIPKPVTALPGSTPITRINNLPPGRQITGWKPVLTLLRGRELGQLFGVDIEIGGDVLHVFVVLQFLDQFQDLLGAMARHPYGIFGRQG